MSWLLIATATMAIAAMVTSLIAAVQHYRHSSELEAKLTEFNVRLRRVLKNVEEIEEILDEPRH